jgi:hypothetical protein
MHLPLNGVAAKTTFHIGGRLELPCPLLCRRQIGGCRGHRLAGLLDQFSCFLCHATNP